ncbi:hypothetical protein ACOSQ4_020431 [Xanthoceras sorbifolium]
MSQLSESGGVQTNVTINGLPSSLGGSAHQPQLSEAQISAEKFLFHVAALSCQWGLVLKLLELIVSPQSLAVQDVLGNTVLHYVAQGGSLNTCKALVKKNSDLLQIVNKHGDLPLFFSIFSDS